MSAIVNLGLQQTNQRSNPYLMEFTVPSDELLKRMFSIDCAPVESIYKWLLDNAERQSCDYDPMNKQNDVAVETDATDEVFLPQSNLQSVAVKKIEEVMARDDVPDEVKSKLADNKRKLTELADMFNVEVA